MTDSYRDHVRRILPSLLKRRARVGDIVYFRLSNKKKPPVTNVPLADWTGIPGGDFFFSPDQRDNRNCGVVAETPLHIIKRQLAQTFAVLVPKTRDFSLAQRRRLPLISLVYPLFGMEN